MLNKIPGDIEVFKNALVVTTWVVRPGWYKRQVVPPNFWIPEKSWIWGLLKSPANKTTAPSKEIDILR